jgi:hypothetical protein
MDYGSSKYIKDETRNWKRQEGKAINIAIAAKIESIIDSATTRK